jgi:hypothetical protein
VTAILSYQLTFHNLPYLTTPARHCAGLFCGCNKQLIRAGRAARTYGQTYRDAIRGHWVAIPAGGNYRPGRDPLPLHPQPVKIKSRTVRQGPRSAGRDPMPGTSQPVPVNPGKLARVPRTIEAIYAEKSPKNTRRARRPRASTNGSMSHVSRKYSSGISNGG